MFECSNFFCRHVPVAEEHWQYLGISLQDEEGQPMYWVWTVLVLGLRDACHIFSRLTAPVMGRLREGGWRGQIYVDDLLTSSESYNKALMEERKAKELFQGCGWIFKESKRSGEPSQLCRFLGLLIDSKTMKFRIPEDKILQIKGRLDEVARRSRVQVKVIARAIGSLQAVSRATGPIVAVLTRSLYVAIAKAKSWRSWVVLDELAMFELEWWRTHIEEVTEYPIQGSKSVESFSYETAGDASEIGNFVYLVGEEREPLAGREFSTEEQGESSTWRELSGFRDVWTRKENLERFRGSNIAHYTDSKAMAAIVAKGSRNPKLQPLILEAVLALRKYHISVVAMWRSRESGVIKWADMGSREYYGDDIEMDFFSMSLIYEKFGDFDVDGFGSRRTSKGRRFYSKVEEPGTAGVDFFHQKLDAEDSHFCFPPPHLLVPAWMHIKRWRVSAVMVVPVWANSTFYSHFWPDGRHAAPWVQGMLLLQPDFICGPLVTSTGMRGRKSYLTGVLLVDFRKEAKRLGSNEQFCLWVSHISMIVFHVV